MRENVKRRVHATEHAVRNDSLDQRELGDALDRLQAVSDELWQEHHQCRKRDRSLREGSEHPDGGRGDGRRDERSPDTHRTYDARGK